MPIIKNGHTTMRLLENGAIGKIMSHGIMVNQIEGNPLDGSFSNIFLRMQQGNRYTMQPLMGPKSSSQVVYTDNTVQWTGEFSGVAYQLELLVLAETWFWTLDLQADQPRVIDVTYSQDLGLGLENFVKTNTAYASQYIDHHVVESQQNITVASRQNQGQSGQNPYLQQGSFSELASYSTDAQQFFGTAYKLTGQPSALQQPQLAQVNKQYESAYTALRTQTLTLDHSTQQIIFYASFVEHQPENNVRLLKSAQELHQQYEAAKRHGSYKTLKQESQGLKLTGLLTGEPLTTAEMNALFPEKCQSEYRGQQLLSFFQPDGSHVVLPEKERLQERLTGNIAISGTQTHPGAPVLATTHYMTGVFESHTVYGNADFNRLSTDVSDAYNVFKIDGTRIYIQVDGVYRILGMPSAFVMHYNGADWYYKLNDDLLKISDDAGIETQQITLRFESLQHKKYDVLVTTRLNHVTLGENYRVETHESSVAIHPESHQLLAEKMPELGYQMVYAKHDARLLTLGDEIVIGAQLLSTTRQLQLAKYKEVSEFAIQTGLTGHGLTLESQSAVRVAHQQQLTKLLRHVTLSTQQDDKRALVERTNLILPWFAHDALIHLLSPHGLEQTSGAAWGTRDVSQGPAELFLATGHFDAVRQIIKMVYANQFSTTEHWPQWFIFDQYAGTYAQESHGDVVVWPLKVVADYLLATQDLDILSEPLPYLTPKDAPNTHAVAQLSDHIMNQIAYIEAHFLFDTAVSAYGDGDWDDTLQPADAKQKQTMASTWTQELTIETFKKLAQALPRGSALQSRCQQLAARMSADFRKYFMADDTLPGFIQLTADHAVHPIIYPGDPKTGINYRLLPLSQGVLSGVLVDEEAANALRLIRDHLLYPDGVRLMDRPARYHGGVSETFKRAEQAANFGREIGLLYVHAHIRYAEAVATRGDQAEAWRLLDLVNPINLSDRVTNASLRQANVYFSSSDADFDTRYAAQANYDLVAQQQVAVKGGWRIYSSGPGIYISALLQGVLSLSQVDTQAGPQPLAFDPEIKLDSR